MAEYVNQLPGNYSRSIMAHSMGNVVCASALKEGMNVDRYVMLNAAMAAMSYDGGNPNIETINYTTPDTAPSSDTATLALGLRNQVNPASTKIVNFYLPDDSALDKWAFNHQANKPNRFFGKDYRYDSYADSGNKLQRGYWTQWSTGVEWNTQAIVTELPESMGFVTASRSFAVGTLGKTPFSRNASISQWVGMDGIFFGSTYSNSRDEHSAEWVWTLQADHAIWAKLYKVFTRQDPITMRE